MRARVVLTVAVLLGVVCAVGLHGWTRSRVVHHGQVVALVDGRELHLGAYDQTGVGSGGRLGLVGGRCLGVVGGQRGGTVVVWPAGTRVVGSGARVGVHSQGQTIRLGQTFTGGSSMRTRFPTFAGRVPEACVRAGFVDVAPGE